MEHRSAGNKANAGHFAPLDGLRGVAVLAVIFTHAYHYSGSYALGRAIEAVTKSGWVGVTLFFALSGYLITGILLDNREKPNWYVTFLVRRSLRIFPLYYLFLAIYFFILPMWARAAHLLPLPEGAERACYWFYLANMTEWITSSASDIFSLKPLWSLSVEEQFYLLWPLFIRFVPWQMMPRFFIGMFLLSLTWKTGTFLLKQPVEMRYMWTPACMDAFSGGGLVAWLSRDREGAKRLPSLARITTLGMGLFLLGIAAGQRHFNFWWNPGPMLTLGSSGVAVFFSALIGILVSSPETAFANRLFASGCLCWCGRYSYCAYIVHELVIALLTPLFPGWDAANRGWTSIPQAAVGAGSVLLCTFGIAWLSWHLFEKHFLALKKYFPSGGQAARLERRAPRPIDVECSTAEGVLVA